MLTTLRRRRKGARDPSTHETPPSEAREFPAEVRRAPAQATDATVRIVQITALAWIGYFALLAVVDRWFVMLRPGSQALPAMYYVDHGLAAVALLVLTRWNAPRRLLGAAFLPLIIVFLALVPLAVVPLLLPNLPPGPITATPGLLGTRQAPIQVVGLLLVASHYGWRQIIAYTLTVIGLTVLASAGTPAFAIVVGSSLILAISFLILGYYINSLINRLSSQRAELEQANLNLRHYASTLEHLTVSRERNRMARELHDTLAHTLSGLTVQLETIKAYWNVDAAAARTMVDKAVATSRTGLQETRQALKALRTSPLDDLGLLLALESLFTSAAAAANLRLDMRLPAAVPALASDTEHAVYRIAQEAVANAVQHAGAAALTVRMTAVSDRLTLAVTDDGRGFDTQQQARSGHFGLAGMRERAMLMGARIAIASAAGRGTTITIALDL